MANENFSSIDGAEDRQRQLLRLQSRVQTMENKESTISSFEAKSLASVQAPSSTGSAIQIEFGEAQVTDDIDIDALGTVTFKTTGVYDLGIDVHYGRENNTGVALMFVRSLFNDVQLAPSFYMHLDNSKIQAPFSQSSKLLIPAGTALKFELVRDSSGVNDGGLYSANPTLAGWSDASCARLRIVKRQGI
jgi:hypothetical protein